MAQLILDWRQWGTSEAAGFFSKEYYANLEYPYRKKDADYEVLDELLLVKGVTRDIYERILPYVTIYGEGKVNINTASGPVLAALGLDDDLVAKILSVRRGKDGVENTFDDHFFARTFDIATEVQAAVKLDPAQVQAIDALNVQGILTIDSFHFTLEAHGRLANSPANRKVRVVFLPRENRIAYWKER